MMAQRLKTGIPCFVFFILFCPPLASFAGADEPREKLGQRIHRHCAERDISGGVLLYLGDPDNALLTELAEMSNERFLVRVLLSEDVDLAQRRERLLTDGLYGKISLVHWSGSDLPFIPNVVNVLVIDSPDKVSRDEI